jgi:putative DNA primase/helicase
MTGGDEIRARFMRQDFFTYVPQYTLMIYGNHKPGLKSVDDAMRRRLKLIPFAVRIPDADRDKELPEKLKAEWPGILAWMLEGCLLWQREGLIMPKAVEAATEDYLATEDAIGRWFEECCVKDPQARESVARLYESWSTWAARSGEHVGSAKRFSQILKDRGFEPKKTAAGTAFIGLKTAVDIPSDGFPPARAAWDDIPPAEAVRDVRNRTH